MRSLRPKASSVVYQCCPMILLFLTAPLTVLGNSIHRKLLLTSFHRSNESIPETLGSILYLTFYAEIVSKQTY